MMEDVRVAVICEDGRFEGTVIRYNYPVYICESTLRASVIRFRVNVEEKSVKVLRGGQNQDVSEYGLDEFIATEYDMDLLDPTKINDDILSYHDEIGKIMEEEQFRYSYLFEEKMEETEKWQTKPEIEKIGVEEDEYYEIKQKPKKERNTHYKYHSSI